ncbi:hypothetical protein [Haloquadratum walsbyi]|uniref:Uncharacterized protein n=1 Tax=Haloquadratum walsbyi J07HQW2 TaxID=1238425 RepID=U1PQI5_9EURY|nr:hypothetical protein [Haloquadratum walsbyi]ERG96027.1 MAG: hypothetical protein J07HQW2_02494 [Haloquadratum walsbyi J07HQW2]
MAGRLPSDHDQVQSYRASLTRSGRIRRPSLQLPTEITLTENEIIRLLLDEQQTHARVSVASVTADEQVIRGAFENSRVARTPGDGENLLNKWCEKHDLEIGDAVEIDVLDAGFCYGLRSPGDRVVYSVPSRPNESLHNIASNLDHDTAE